MTTTIETEPATELIPASTGFNAYAVRSRSGPHVTMQAGVLHAGRFWTTTSRRSLKTRSVARHGVASAVVPDGDRSRIVSGRTTTLDILRPFSLVSDLTAPVRAPWAVLRLGVAQMEQVIGYLEASGSIPADWLPHRRALLVTKPDRTLTIDGFDVVETGGSWTDREDVGTDTLTVGGAVGPDADLPVEPLAASHRALVGLHERVHLGVSTPTGPVAVPARWAGEGRFLTSAPALAVADAELPGKAVAVFDQSTSRRPDEKLGVMFRGSASIQHVDGALATVSLQTDRVTTWDGFDARTVTVAG